MLPASRRYFWGTPEYIVPRDAVRGINISINPREVIATDVDRPIATEPRLCIECGQPLPHTVLDCLTNRRPRLLLF